MNRILKILPKSIKNIGKKIIKTSIKAKPETQHVIDKYIKPEDIVIEVGARFGGGTLSLSKVAKFVHTFEASPFSYQYLKKNTKNLTNVKIYNFAIGNKKGSIDLYVPANDKTSGALGFFKYDTQEYSGETINCPLIRLDEMKMEPKSNVLFSDCEGYEVEVLQGCDLKNFDKIIIEWHRIDDNYCTRDNVIAILEKADFKIHEDKYLIGTRK